MERIAPFHAAQCAVAYMDVGEGREQDAEASLIAPYSQHDNIYCEGTKLAKDARCVSPLADGSHEKRSAEDRESKYLHSP